MLILSIDIGIKNLACALLENNDNNLTIKYWDTINLCNFIPNCSCCNNQAKFYKNKIFYCKKHSKNSEFKIPTIDIKSLLKENVKNIKILADKYEISYNKSDKKNELIKLFEDYVNNNYLENVQNINANNINLIDIGINIKKELDKLFLIYNICDIDMIIIENQISPIANRMKTIQGMIAQYFINKENYNIEFISAVNKLKLFVENKKTSYNERKKLSIKFSQEYLLKHNLEKEYIFFCKHKKKDDLADSLLQGLYYLSCNDKLIL